MIDEALTQSRAQRSSAGRPPIRPEPQTSRCSPRKRTLDERAVITSLHFH
jgi:hypothetical protein